MKIKLFTHTDLDGVGCGIIANHVFGAENVDIEYCDYKEVNAKIFNFVSAGFYRTYDHIFITDISVNEEVAAMLDVLDRETKTKVRLIDHHPTALWLDKEYPWADVVPSFYDSMESRDKKICGTGLFLDYLDACRIAEDTENHGKLWDFAEQVRRYDTWEWDTIYKQDYPKSLNNLLYLIGRRAFLERFTADLNLEFTSLEAQTIATEETKIKYYIERVGKTIIPASIQGYNAGVVFAEQYSSELGNVLAINHPEFDFIAIVNTGQGTVSYRGIRNDIDLGKDIAEKYGGGGHPKASGSRIKEKDLNKLIIRLFQGEENTNG